MKDDLKRTLADVDATLAAAMELIGPLATSESLHQIDRVRLARLQIRLTKALLRLRRFTSDG